MRFIAFLFLKYFQYKCYMYYIWYEKTIILLKYTIFVEEQLTF